MMLKERVGEMEQESAGKVAYHDLGHKLGQKADISELRQLSERISDLLRIMPSRNSHLPSPTSEKISSPVSSPTFDAVRLDAMLKPHLAKIRQEIKAELVNDSLKETKRLSESISSLEASTNRTLSKHVNEQNERLGQIQASLEKTNLNQQALLAELEDLKSVISGATKTASSAHNRVEDVCNSILPTLASTASVKREIANLSGAFELIPRLEKRIRALEREDAATSISAKRPSLQPLDETLITKLTSKIDQLASDVSLVQTVNLDLSSKKVDISVLEELMRHIATRDEVKKVLKKANAANFSKAQPDEAGQAKLEERLMQHIDHRLSLAPKLPDNTENIEQRLFERIHSRVDANVVKHIAKIQSAISDIQSIIARQRNGAGYGRNIDRLEIDEVSDGAINTLRRDFDEKLYLVCADLAECKSAWKLASRNPLQRAGCWLWNSRRVKLGSTIPWNVEALNTGTTHHSNDGLRSREF